LLLSKKARKFVPPSFKRKLAFYEFFFIFIRRVVLNVFSHFSVVRRTLNFTSLTSLFVLLFAANTLAQTRTVAPIKITLKPQTVTFLGTKGDGGSPCEGTGMCRGTMLRENESLASFPRTEKSVTAEGRFTMQDGKLHFILTHISSANGANLTNISSFPFDRHTELPRDMARSLGFTSVTVIKSRYSASMEGIFPVQAKFSVGLNAASVPAPRGERHASVSFEVLRQMNVSVVVLDANGKKVATLLENKTIEGSETAHMLSWNGKNDAGKNVASGEYRVEVRCVLTDSGASFAESVPVILAPVAIAH
jgi:hypothetical protein